MLKLLSTLLLAALLVGCASPAEKQAFTTISDFYGGSVTYEKGVNASTNAGELQGHYLSLTLNSPGILRRFERLDLPASNCAYLAYHTLTPTEQQEYDYYRVAIKDSNSTQTFNFSKAQLAQASQAYVLANDFLTNLQKQQFDKILSACYPPAFASVTPDTLRAMLGRTPRYLAPFASYRLHGFVPRSASLGGQPQPIIEVLASVPRPDQSSRQFTVLVNPQLSPTDKYVYGFHLVR